MAVGSLYDFVKESNRIEGIRRRPLLAEIEEHRRLLRQPRIVIQDLVSFVATIQPGAILRERVGLNVYVGNHVPPPGGPDIRGMLAGILEEAVPGDAATAYQSHHAYETLHPFTDGNGRSGRALWLWMMRSNAPLGFLHHWYYQSLAYGREHLRAGLAASGEG